MKKYIISRTAGGVTLAREEEPGDCVFISPERSQAVFNHSPDGFEFGYLGSGPSQLALAILIDAFDGRAPSAELAAISHYHAFKEAFLQAKGDLLEIAEEDIIRWVGERIAEGV